MKRITILLGSLKFFSQQTGSPYGLFRGLLSNDARSKAGGRARQGEPAIVLVRFEALPPFPLD